MSSLSRMTCWIVNEPLLPWELDSRVWLHIGLAGWGSRQLRAEPLSIVHIVGTRRTVSGGGQMLAP